MNKQLVIRGTLYSYLRSLIIVGCAIILSQSTVIYANELDFAVTPEISSTQVTGSPRNYFDLKIQPKQQTTLKVKVVNFSSAEQTFLATVYNAWTNDNGIVEYTDVIDSNKIFGKYKITDIAKLNTEQLTLAPRASGYVYIGINMPTDEYSGLIAGSISVKKEDPQSKFRRNIALLIRNNEKAITPNFNVADGQIVAHGDEKKIKFRLRNESGMYQNLVNVSTNLSMNRKKYTKAVSNIQMAPWSEMEVEQEVDLGEKTTSPLRVSVEVTVKDEKQTFTDTVYLKSTNTKLRLTKTTPVNNTLFLIYYAGLIGLTLVIVCKYESNSRKK